MSMAALRVALYARVSSDQQTEQGTIASQVAALEAKILEDGLHLEPDHRFIDEGRSGATLIRPALERLRDAVAAGSIDRVYVHSPDRLARHYAYQVLVIDEFRRLGVEIVFLNRAIGLSPEDDLLLQVQGMVAEYERAKILERSRRGKRHAAHHGRVSVLSGAPYGYRYIGKHEGGGVARYAIDEAEAPAVRLMFQWIGHERLSIGEVCRRLQQRGCLTRSGKSAWDRTTVWGILKNPAYIGTAAFGKTRIGAMRERLRPVRGGAEQPRWPYSTYDVPENEWLRMPVPALIETELFATVQEQLTENRRRNRQNRRGQRYLLQGLLVCRRCGYAYYGKAISPRAAKGKRRDYAYYRCCGSDAHRFGGQRLCANPQLRTDRTDAAVWQEVQRLLQTPELIAAEYERRLHQAQHPDTDRSDLATTEAEIAKLRRGVARLIDGYAEGLIEKDEFEQRITGLRQRIKVWGQQSAALQDAVAWRRTLSLLIGRLEDFAKQIQQRMTTLDWSLQRDLIRLLIKRVEVDHDEINVVFRVPPPPGFLPPNPKGDRSLQDCWRRDEQLAGQGHDSDAPDPSLRCADPIVEPAAQGRVRLMTQPKPGEFDHDAPQAVIAGLGDALVPVGPAALPRARRQSGVSGHLAPVGEAAEQPLEPDKRGEFDPHALELDQQCARVCRFRRLRAHQCVTGPLDGGELGRHHVDPGQFPADFGFEPVRQRAPIAGPQRIETVETIGLQGIISPNALPAEQPFDPIGMLDPLLEQGAALP